MNFQNYVSRANKSVAVILQIEHIEAVNHIDDIIGVDGIDALFIGPCDLSGSMDRLGQVDHPDVVKAMETVRKVCAKREMCLGVFVADAVRAETYLKEGFQLIAVGMDSFYLWRSAKETLERLCSS